MKNLLHIFLILMTLIISDNTAASVPYFSIRSQGVNTVREMVGWEDLINRCDSAVVHGAVPAEASGEGYGAFYIAAQYGQTFKPGSITRCLFGADAMGNSQPTPPNGMNQPCDAALTISGSRAATRGNRDWLADYFGLPTDFISTITFKPRITNFVTDIGLYFGLDSWAEGFYLRFHLPVTSTHWDLRAHEHITTPGTNSDVPGYFDSVAIGRTNLLEQALDFFNGFAPTLPADPTNNISITFNPLIAGKWSTDSCLGGCNGRGKIRCADLEVAFGYNFICNDDDYLGISVRTEAPTGNKPTGEYLFEPIVGNGGFWTLGAGLNAKYTFSQTASGRTWSAYLDANVTHLFTTCQRRTFDLCGKPNSRYMLAQKLGANSTTLQGCANQGDTCLGPLTLSNSQFNNEYTPVANITLSSVKVSVAVQADVALKFEYAHPCGFIWDLGYNFWGRSCETICRKNGCESAQLDGSTWALKGDAHIFGFVESSSTPVALAATQSAATIHGGTNGFNDSNSVANAAAIDNPGIDHQQFALQNGTALVATPGATVTDQTRTSLQPVYLALSDVDFTGTRGLSNKLFTHFNYMWGDSDDWLPFLGVGASAELGASCTASKRCRQCAVTQWDIWIKGGVAFN